MSVAEAPLGRARFGGILVLMLLVLALGVGLGVGLGRREPAAGLTARFGVREDEIPDTPRPAPVGRPLTPPPQFPAATGDFILGINEGVAVPGRYRDRGLDLITADLVEDAATLVGLGASMVRAHTGAYPPVSFSGLSAPSTVPPMELADAWVRTVHAAGLEGVMMVSPWPGNHSAEAAIRAGGAYVPADLPAYEAYVRGMVERYDLDGIDDMPGLTRPIRYWEVDNEPDLKNTLPPKGMRNFDPSTFCRPEEYAQVLLASSRAIRAASPEARVLIGGFYRPHAETGKTYVRGVVAVPGVLDAFDIVSVHTYSDDQGGDLLAEALRFAREAMPGKPLWVTETNAGSSGKKPWMNEEWQAKMVAVIHARAILEGATALFWHSLVEPPGADEANTLHQGSLYRVDRAGVLTEKLAVAAYRRLAVELRARTVAGAKLESPGVLRFADGSALLFDGDVRAPSGATNLLDGARVDAGKTATAPAWLDVTAR